MILSWKTVAAKIRAEIAEKIQGLDRKPKLSVVLAGENPASVAYVSQKEKACAEVGMAFELVKLTAGASETEILAAIEKMNGDSETDGIIVQLPLPAGVDRDRIVDAIRPDKDVDGFTKENIGKTFLGRSDGLAPCTPKGIVRLLSEFGISPIGKEIVVIGYGNIVGKPLSIMLSNLWATVTACHSKTKDFSFYTKTADIVVVAVGKPGLLKREHLKTGAVVIDVGITRTENGLVGDADFMDIEKDCSITPVPGGVGPMTVAMLLENTFEAAKRKSAN